MLQLKYEIVEYLDANQKSPYEQWFTKLDPVAAAKITVALLRVAQGNDSNIKWFRGLGECKIDFGPGYRVYLAKAGNKLILLLGGGSKKSQQKDIRHAILSFNEYKQRVKLEK